VNSPRSLAGTGPEPAVSTPSGGLADPVLVAEHLTKCFGDRTAVDDLNLEVARGEVFGFLGPNGAGKSTTVRMLGTIIVPTSGSALVAGVPLAPGNGVEIRRRISVMPESPGLYLRLSVRENLELFAGLYGLRPSSRRIGAALEAVNMSGRASDTCGSLSKGLRQRVALARALLNDPQVVFLDEPTAGLDPVATREVHELIDSLRRHAVTVFLTTHRLEEAERLCDRVAIFNTTLRLTGRPEELRRQLFTRALEVRTLSALPDPGQVFEGLPGVEGWRSDQPGSYLLRTSEPSAAAPAVARSLVAAGADVLAIGEGQPSATQAASTRLTVVAQVDGAS